MEMEMYNSNHITKTAVANNEGDDKHGTRTEGAGDGYGAIQ